jgi:hypothetical protein
LRLCPDDLISLCNLGNVFLAQNRLDEALRCYRRTLAIQPGFCQALFNESLVLLLKGDLKAGFRGYELRWLLQRQALENLPPREKWCGDRPVAGQTLLVCCEQGLGDTLQFVRYLPLLQARGAKVILRVQPSLKALLLPLPNLTLVSSEDKILPPFDHYCLLLSLPLAFGTELATIPAEVPYLQPPPEKVAYWRKNINHYSGPKIGVVCSGSPEHRNDYSRSCPLSAFKLLAAALGVRLYLIQKHLNPADTETLAGSPEFVDLSSELTDFTDTAAIIANLDLVISVDTSVVHLAGALGKPVWTLLPYAPDWRWMLSREDSPWYPTMRLFRQPTPGDWTSVLDRVSAALKTLRTA